MHKILPFQHVSLCGVQRLKPIFCIGSLGFRDVRWYVKTHLQENPDLEQRIEQKPKLQTLDVGSRMNLIMDFFNVSKTTAYEIIRNEPRLQQVDLHDMFRNIQVLNSNGLNPDEVRKNLQLLYFSPLTIEHRIAILNELGLENLSAFQYTKFVKLFKSPVSLIKSHKLLPSKYDAVNVLVSLGVPKEVYENVRVPHDIDKLTLGQVHRFLSFIYLCWYFQCEEEHIEYVFKTYKPSPTKSMRLRKQLFKKLKENWNFSSDEILRHGFLLCGSPTNVELIEKNVKHLVGADPKVVAHNTPRILTTPYHQLFQVNEILTKLGVTEAAVLQTSHIFTLHPETLEERIKELLQVPEFAGMHTHPRILRLIHYSTKVKSRLDLLRQIKDTRSMPSLNILTGDQEKFNNYVAMGYLRLNRRDIVTLLSKRFHVSSSFIRKTLRAPSQRHQTSIISVEKNLAYLLEKGFTSKQILNSLEILVYPHEIVMQHLQHLPERVNAISHEELVANPYSLQIMLYYVDKDVPY